MKRKIKDYKENAWLSFASDHPNLQIARSCLVNVYPKKFWAITAECPDLVCRLHVQTRADGLAGIEWRGMLALRYRWGTLFCLQK